MNKLVKAIKDFGCNVGIINKEFYELSEREQNKIIKNVRNAPCRIELSNNKICDIEFPWVNNELDVTIVDKNYYE